MPSPKFSQALRNLRHRAERRLGTGPSALAQLVRELQTHQLELELQHEELLLAQARAETSRAQYAALYHEAPVGYCSLDRNGTLRQLNHCASQLLGYPAGQLLGQQLAQYVAPSGLEQLTTLLHQLQTTPDKRLTAELPLRRATGEPRYVQVEGVFRRGNHTIRQQVGYHLVLLDITARHTATAALTASEARFRATFEQSHDGIVLLENHRCADANHAARRLLGYPTRA